MIEKTVRKRKLNDPDQIREDREYWMSRPSSERISAVEILRRQYYGNTEGLQRVYRIVKLGES